MTPNEALARSLPCDDPEEPCDTDGRDEHRWCDNCIARSVVARSKLVLVEAEELERLRVLSESATKGPWYWEPGDRMLQCRVGSEGHRRGVGDFTLFGIEPQGPTDEWDQSDPAEPEADAAFIVAAVNFVRAALRGDSHV